MRDVQWRPVNEDPFFIHPGNGELAQYQLFGIIDIQHIARDLHWLLGV